jgi:hypothetical protein
LPIVQPVLKFFILFLHFPPNDNAKVAQRPEGSSKYKIESVRFEEKNCHVDVNNYIKSPIHLKIKIT